MGVKESSQSCEFYMKILLSTIPREGEYVNWTTPYYFKVDKVNKYMPLGILSLATNLPETYDITVIDPSSDEWDIEKTISFIENEKPDVLGLSVLTRRIYGMNRILKETSVPYKVVGGPHATYYSDKILKAGADAVFIGPLADLEFNSSIKNKRKGIIYCNTKINDIKFPRRDFLNINNYFPKASVLFKAEKRLPMFSSIGCPNKCTFCNVQSKKLQLKNPKNVLDEMEYLQSIGCKSIHVLDDNFNINRNHLKGILDEMDKRNFNMEWSGRGQTKMDFSLLPRLKAHGFKRIHVGIEALDNKILKFFRKNETTKDINNFCKAINKNDIDILGYFIIGSPVETREYRKGLANKIKELGIKHILVNILFPEPNTEYYYQLIRDGIFKEDYWKKYMDAPIPNYELPYPYGKDKQEEIWNFISEIIEDFNEN
jgi:radical SAM superfamily enzyme YgiQ (UPF0313 family)